MAKNNNNGPVVQGIIGSNNSNNKGAKGNNNGQQNVGEVKIRGIGNSNKIPNGTVQGGKGQPGEPGRPGKSTQNTQASTVKKSAPRKPREVDDDYDDEEVETAKSGKKGQDKEVNMNGFMAGMVISGENYNGYGSGMNYANYEENEKKRKAFKQEISHYKKKLKEAENELAGLSAIHFIRKRKLKEDIEAFKRIIARYQEDLKKLDD